MSSSGAASLRAVADSAASGWVVVQPGDSLWHLAERHLGDALRWEEIYELNAGALPGGGTLRDPNLIHPGWRLRLPVPEPPSPVEATGSVPEAVQTQSGPPGPG